MKLPVDWSNHDEIVLCWDEMYERLQDLMKDPAPEDIHFILQELISEYEAPTSWVDLLFNKYKKNESFGN